MMKRVRCSLVFFYDPETFIWETDENIPTEEEIFKRCREMFIEDITSYTDPITAEFVKAEFVEEEDGN